MITSFKELVRKAPKDLQQVFWQQWKAPQNPTYHPEGNTLKHIAIVVTRAIKNYPDNINIILSAFFHDLGKFKTLAFNKNNQPTAHGHENVSVELVDKYKDWITSMGGNPEKIRYIVANHMKMKPQVWDVMKDTKKQKITNDPSFSNLDALSKIDKGGNKIDTLPNNSSKTDLEEDLGYAHVDSAAPENDEYKIGIVEGESTNTEMKSKLVSLSNQFALAAQRVYDQWQQNEDGVDDVYGGGGICDDIAEKMCEVVHQYTDYGCFTRYDEYACHTSIYVYDTDTKSLFFVDISPYNYETGGGYSWTKIPNVRFHSSMIDVHDQSGYWDNFFDEEGQERDLDETELHVIDQTEPVYAKDEYGDNTKEIVGQTPYKRFTYDDEIGGEASGSIYGDTARIIRMQSVPSQMRYTPQEGDFKRRGFFKKLIKALSNHGIKKIEINLQSNETQAAVKRLLQTGVLSNPSGIVGSSNNEHPTRFDVGNLSGIQETNMSITGTVAEDYPTTFNQQEFEKLRSFRERIQYCNTHLKKIAQGSSRIVYAVDDKMVLKLAKNGKGIDQNRTEAEIGVDHYFEELVAQTFKSSNDDHWIEMEYAKKVTPQRFQQLIGVDIELVKQYVVNWHRESNSRKPVFPMTKEVRDQLWDNRFVSHLTELLANYEMQPYDITDIKNYGEVLRNGKPTIVLTDFGLNDDLWKNGYKRPVF